MKRAGSTFTLQVESGEKITVKIQNTVGIIDTINYALDGAAAVVLPQATPYEHVPFGPDPSPINLAVTVTFANNSGGTFTSQVTGSQGGDVSTYKYDQPDGQAFETLVYTLVKA